MNFSRVFETNLNLRGYTRYTLLHSSLARTMAASYGTQENNTTMNIAGYA